MTTRPVPELTETLELLGAHLPPPLARLVFDIAFDLNDPEAHECWYYRNECEICATWWDGALDEGCGEAYAHLTPTEVIESADAYHYPAMATTVSRDDVLAPREWREFVDGAAWYVETLTAVFESDSFALLEPRKRMNLIGEALCSGYGPRPPDVVALICRVAPTICS